MTVLKPPVHREDAQRKPAHDHARGGYPLAALERLLYDCDNQPLWRDRSDICCAYYDGDQLTNQQIHETRKKGLDPRATNLIGRVINGVLGQEAKSRRDPTLDPDDDDFADVADVLNVRLKEAQRETNADMAISTSYASQIKAGLGWGHVYRQADPFQYEYVVEDVPRHEMWWDWRARKVDLSDARWVCRMQWKDLDEVTAFFPEHAEVLKQQVDGYAHWLQDGPIDEERVTTSSLENNTRWFRTRRTEWVDGVRERVKLYEVEYKVPSIAVVMRVGHRKIIVDEGNPAHVAAISRGLVKLERVPTMQIRRSIFAGPVRLSDEETKLKRFSYVPFFAFRRDADDTPYGLIEGMISPQDDYNEASERVRWMLKAQQLIIDEDALATAYNTIVDITETMNRPDMVAVLNKARTNKDAMSFRNDLGLQKELVERMDQSKLLVQDVPGVYSTQLGNAPAGVSSGIAINSLVEQGIVAMGELNDNYMLARRQMFELLVDLIAEDHVEKDMEVIIGSGQNRRPVVLNTIDPQTGRAKNVVKDAPVKLGLGEAPSSPAYQMQMSQLMGNMISALAGTPHAAVLVPSWVEQTPMFGPGRKQIADDMRRVSGLPTAGDRQGAQAWQQQQQQAAQQQAQLAARAAEAQIVDQEAKTAKTMAETEKVATDAAFNVVKIAQADGEIAANEDALIQESLAEALAPRAAAG